MFQNKFFATFILSLCMMLGVISFSTLTVKAETSGTLKMEEDGIFYYYEGDEWIKDKYGYVEFDGSRFLVANGVVADYMNGLAQDPENEADWYFLSNGLAQTQYTGLVQYDGEWFYISEGKLDTTINDYVEYDGCLFFVAVGRIVSERHGLAKDPNGDDWYYLAEGKAQTQYTGLAEYDGEWFYIEAGKLKEEFSGIVKYNGGYFRIANSMMVEQVYEDTLKMVQEICYSYTLRGSMIGHTVREFDDNGIDIKYTVYDVDGNIKQIDLYDEYGELVKSTIYNEDGTNYDRFIEEYNEDRSQSVFNWNNSDGSNDWYGIIYYDEQGRTERIDYYYSGGDNLSERLIYEYDDKQNREKLSYYDSKCNLSRWSIREYDVEGSIIRETEYNKDGSINTIFEFNKDGLVTYLGREDGNGNIITMAKGECDSEGKLIRYINYDENSQVTCVYKYEYDDEGRVICCHETWINKELAEEIGAFNNYTQYICIYK